MDDLPTNHDESAVREALAELERDTGWHCWVGVLPHLLYGWRKNTSPAWLVRAPDPGKLREEIAAFMRGQR